MLLRKGGWTINALIDEAKAKGWRTILVLVAIDPELQAVLAHLADTFSLKGRDGSIYECGYFRDSGSEFIVVLVETGPGNHEAHNAVINAHIALDRIDIKPEFQVFVGVAGSRKKDVPIGSVVAASHVYSPYVGKYGPDGFSARPRVFMSEKRLIELAKKVKRDKKWVGRITNLHDQKLPEKYPCDFPPIAVIAPLVSTESVLADKANALEAHISLHYGDACVVEMEGYGSLSAAENERTPAIVIRGVSDMAEQKEPETDKVRQPVAAAHAAAFTFELISLWAQYYPKEEAVQANADPSTFSAKAPGAPDPVPVVAETNSQSASSRFVVNIDVNVRGLSLEQIASIEAVLREVADSNAIKVERIEEESRSFIVFDSSSPLGATAAEKVRNELRSRFSLNLLGIVPEQIFRELKSVALELSNASHDLLQWPITLPDGEQFGRPELQQLLSIAKEQDRSVTAVIGDPGSGKSALLAMLGKALIQAGHPVLAIKADLLDANVSSEQDLQDWLGLSDRPSVMLDRLSRLEPVFLLIDQLDALASYLDLRTSRLSVLLNLVRRLGKSNNIHIVISARKFEYEHDVRLRAISADSLQLQLPGWSEVLELLQSKGIAAAGWPKDAQEVLRSPQALSIYLQLDERMRSEPLLSYQSMLDRLWDEQVLSGASGASRSRVALDIANQMAEEESLWMPRAKLDDVKAEVDALIAMGILVLSASGSSVGFAHQTVFDYTLARSFAKVDGRLHSFVVERQASIFCRPKIWAALTYLRGADPKRYEKEISLIWNESSLRRLVRLLLIDFLGQQNSPTDAEEILLLSAFASSNDRALAFRAITGSSGWFARLERSIIEQAMTGGEGQLSLVGPLLSISMNFAPDSVVKLIEKHWLDNPEYDFRSWSVLEQAQSWSGPILDAGIKILRRSKLSPFYLDHIAGSIGVDQPREALLLIRAALDHSLDAAISEGKRLSVQEPPHEEGVEAVAIWNVRNDPKRDIKNLLETSNEWDMLRSLAERAPLETIEIVWPWFIRALDALSVYRHDVPGRSFYSLPYDADFRFDDENGTDLPEPSIPAALRIAVESLAKTDVSALRKCVSIFASSDYHPVHRLVAHALRSNPSEFATDAFDYVLADYRRWSLGHLGDSSETTTSLISAVSVFWTPEQIREYEQRVKNYKPEVPTHMMDVNGRRAWSRIIRKLRLRLLRALPDEIRTQETASLVLMEERAIGDGHSGITFSGVYSPASIMSSTDMARAKDDEIVNAFRALPDATGWDHPSDRRKGGNIQLSREFASFSRANPDRAIRLMLRFEPDFGGRAAGSAIASISEVVDPVVLQDLIVSLVGRGFYSSEFESSVAAAAETLLNRGVVLGEDLVKILTSWLLNGSSPAEDVEPVEDESESEDAAAAAHDDDPGVRSLLWGHGGITILPGNPFPTLHALVRHYLVKKDDVSLQDLLRKCLIQGFSESVWASLLPILRYMRPNEGDDAGPVAALIGSIISHYPDLMGTRNHAVLLAHMHWWTIDFVESELLRWKVSGRKSVRRGYGELVALLAFSHADRSFAKDALEEIRLGSDLEARAGSALTAVNLWPSPEYRGPTTAFLIGMIPSAGDDEWSAVFDLFRIVDELPADENTALLLEAISAHAGSAPHVSATFVVDQLQALLPHHALLVARLALVLVGRWYSELADIRTGTAAHASGLVDLAVTLHRLGPETREDGASILEMLLEINAYEAKSTLDEIDNRFRSTRAIRRPRLPRRQRKARRNSNSSVDMG